MNVDCIIHTFEKPNILRDSAEQSDCAISDAFNNNILKMKYLVIQKWYLIMLIIHFIEGYSLSKLY